MTAMAVESARCDPSSLGLEPPAVPFERVKCEFKLSRTLVATLDQPRVKALTVAGAHDSLRLTLVSDFERLQHRFSLKVADELRQLARATASLVPGQIFPKLESAFVALLSGLHDT